MNNQEGLFLVFLFDLVILRDGGGVVLAGGSPPAQLFVEEAAEDVTALGHEAADSLQEEVPANGETIQDQTTPD